MAEEKEKRESEAGVKPPKKAKEKAKKKPKCNEKGQAKMNLGYSIVWHIVRPIFMLIYGLRFQGMDNVLEPPGGCVVVCNHISLKDPVFLALGIRRQVRFMAKEELFHNKPFAWLIRSLGAFPVSRDGNDINAVRTAMQCVKDGELLIVFAEGGRSKDGVLKPFEKGVAFIAQSCRCDVVPAHIAIEKKARHRSVDFGNPIDVPALSKKLEKNERLDTISGELYQAVLALDSKQKEEGRA